MIKVTIPAWKCLNDVEQALVEAGIPPLPQRNGLMKAWHDIEADAMTYVYTPIEEAREHGDRLLQPRRRRSLENNGTD